MTYLEHIGKLTMDWYNAEYERVKAREARAKIRADHPCENEAMDIDGYCKPCPCHLDSHYKSVGDWCENCQIVQPYWMAYREAAKKAQITRYKITRKIKGFIAKGWQY